MAITAKFLADFDAFKASVQSAEGSLKSLEGASTRLGTTFDSVKGIASTLAGAFGVAFSIGSAVQFGKALVDDAGALVDLNAKTGVSIEQLQRFAFVGKQANVSVDDFAQSSFKLGVALEGGDKGVVNAVGRLGLSFDKLRAMNPDEQFNTVITALEGLGSETERNKLGVELFGKSFSTIAAAVAKGYTEMAAQAQVSSTAQIKAIDDASDAWDRWVSTQKTGITSGLGNMILLDAAVRKLGDGYAQFLIQTNPAIKTTDDLSAALIRAASGHDIVLPKVEKHITLTKEDQVAADKLAAAMVELDSAGTGWLGTLQTIDGETVDAIKFYLEAGVSQNALATAYGLTDVQVKSVVESLKEEAEWNKIVADIRKTTHGLAMDHEQQWREEIEKTKDARNQAVIDGDAHIRTTERDLANFIAQQYMTTSEFEIRKIWEVADEEIKAFKGTTEQAMRYKDARIALAQEQENAILAAIVGVTTAEQALLKKLQDDAVTTFAIIGKGVDDVAAKLDATAQKIKEFSFAGGAMPTPASLSAAAERPGSFLGNTVRTIAQTPGISGIPWQTANQSMVQNIYVTQPFGTPDAVGEAIMARQRALGVRFPGGV